MANIIPTILAHTPDDFAKQYNHLKAFAPRIHIDITDGDFAAPRTIGLAQVHNAANIPIGLHLMLKRPQDQLETAISLHPELIVIHAEADCDHQALIGEIQSLGSRAGLAVLPDTDIESISDLLPVLDHVLIFTGNNLGGHSAEFRRDCLTKIHEARSCSANLEIGVDGGVNKFTIDECVGAGADVLFMGSVIRDAKKPSAAYDLMRNMIE